MATSDYHLCRSCGVPVVADARFCSNCGTPTSGGVRPPARAAEGGNGMAIAGLVCGLLGALFGLIPLLFFLWAPLGICGIVFGSIGINTANRLPGRPNHGAAVAGLVLGVLSFIVPAVACAAYTGAA